MYDDIIHLAMDQQLLTEIRDQPNYKKLPLWKELQRSDDTSELEERLERENKLTFDHVFHEPVGYHLIKAFLQSQHSVDKAVFVKDVELFRSLQDPRARHQVAEKIFNRFIGPDTSNGRSKGHSVFQRLVPKGSMDNGMDGANGGGVGGGNGMDQRGDKDESITSSSIDKTGEYHLSLFTDGVNSVGVYGKPIVRLRKKIDDLDCKPNLFDEIVEDVVQDLRLDVFPRFKRSRWYKMYLRCKTIEASQVTVKEFHQMRMLGRGAFGCVNACKKKDTGKLYAMKQINKRRVQATDSVKTIMAERDFLAMMDSRFLTVLKYAFMDDNTLYLILDLMVGGDLKYHLNSEKTFSEDRSRFYAAEVLLGLEHIHSKGIIYRDLKLENVLVDDLGHCKISDLGLAVHELPEGVKGYAGTPGYTAPEVVLSHYYDHIVDFFSLGVMIYRFLCGRKPFQSRRRGRRGGDRDRDQKRRTTELDRNVVEMEPDFPSPFFSSEARSLLKGLLCKNHERRLGARGIHEIKQHAWFDSIDFGLLEAGYLEPPFSPPLDEIHAEQQQHIGRPPQDEKYARIKIKAEFEESLKGFAFVSSKVIQDEIVGVLERVTAERRHSAASDEEPFPFVENGSSAGGGSCLKKCILM